MLKHAIVHNPNAKMILTCEHCNKNFTSRDYLAQHMLEHTQGRIHLCHLCDKGFVKVSCVIQYKVTSKQEDYYLLGLDVCCLHLQGRIVSCMGKMMMKGRKDRLGSFFPT